MTLIKKKTLEAITTKKGTVKWDVINMLGHCQLNPSERKVFTGYYSGTGRFTSRHSAMHCIKNLLNLNGYKYKEGNDAPRGGAEGEYIKVSKTAFNFLEEVSELN